MTDFASECTQKIPKGILKSLEEEDGAVKVRSQLKRAFKPQAVATASDERRAWELCGIRYMNDGRTWEALGVFETLYDQMHLYQKKSGKRCHKGVPLFWMHDCHDRFGNAVLAKRYLMMTLCEDAITHKGIVAVQQTGAYHRSVWMGMPHERFSNYAAEFWRLFQRNRREGKFPEWLLQKVDQDWMVEKPSPKETTLCPVNRSYIEFLLDGLGKTKGNSLEILALYLVGAMPGCRAMLRHRSKSTDYDVVGVVEGEFADFRSEIGRYFLCECKDWKSPANFAACAKFCRVLDSTKCRFGILFSKKGVTGQGKTHDAERELLKVFHDRGIVIVVVNEADLKRVVEGASFSTMLRSKYEQVRFDLSDAGVKDSLGLA